MSESGSTQMTARIWFGNVHVHMVQDEAIRNGLFHIEPKNFLEYSEHGTCAMNSCVENLLETAMAYTSVSQMHQLITVHSSDGIRYNVINKGTRLTIF